MTGVAGTVMHVAAFDEHLRVLPPAPTDPFRLGAHLADRHGIDDATIDAADAADADTLRRMHAVLHGRPRCGHVHHGRAT